MPNIVQWNDQFLQEFKSWDKERQGRALFLTPHPEFPAYLEVNSFDPLYAHTLKEHIGEYRAVHKLKLGQLLEFAEGEGYEYFVFLDAPDNILGFLDHLDDPYPYELGKALFPFQLRGYNYLRGQRSKFYNWSTGTGKSGIAVPEAKAMLVEGQVDKVVVLSKAHNKINWQRRFQEVGALEAVTDLVSGSSPLARREARGAVYSEADIFIINYEKLKFRPGDDSPKYDASGRKRPMASGDGQELLAALKGKRVLWIWDEMTNKMKSMRTGWYRGAQKLISATKESYHIELTAKKIDRDPDNIYSCFKILDKTIWPSKEKFRQMYAKKMSNFAPWQVARWDQTRLPEIGMKIAHMTHIANKYTDPEIRAQFPEDHWEDVIIDMSDEDRRLYDQIAQGIIDELGNSVPTVASLTPLQLVCNNPLTLLQSESKVAKIIAAKSKLTDQNCAKLETLREMLDDIDGKIVIFSMYNDLGVKVLARYLPLWGHPFVLYDGSAKKKQEAQDRFQSDRRIKVFLSSDAGSDSIDLEQATTVINYDLPWNHSTLVQRVNRISRLTSNADHVFYYNLITANTMEERKLKLLERKRKFEEAVDLPLSEQSDILGSDVSDLLYILGIERNVRS